MLRKRVTQALLPGVGVGLALLLWWWASVAVADLPSPVRTWHESKIYILEPFEKRGEMDQGIGLLAYYSLVRVGQGFLLGILIATPLGFLLGVSKILTRMFDPVMQILRPISPLAWLPLGLILFQNPSRRPVAIAVCSMWPTVISTMAGMRIPQDYWNVAKSSGSRGRRPSSRSSFPRRFLSYRLPPQPRHRVARDCCVGDADRRRCRRLPVAGIQQPG